MSGYNQISPDYFVNYMMAKGWSMNQALGMANNIKAESNFGYDRFQNDKVVPLYTKSVGYGLAQWTNKERKSKFKELFGVELTQSTPEQQMDYLDWELKNTESNAGNMLVNTTTVEDASRIFTTQFERPANKEQEAEERLSALDWLRGKVGDTLGGVASYLPSGGLTGQFKTILSGISYVADNDSTVDNGILPSSENGIFSDYWKAGIIIVGSIALIVAGGYINGTTGGIAKVIKG